MTDQTGTGTTTHAALVVAGAPPTELRRRTPLEFTDEDRALIRQSICPTASDTDFSALMKIACLKRLNPLTRQIYFIERIQYIDGQPVKRWTAEPSIDGLRSKADETGLYDGQDEPEYVYGAESHPLECKVRVYRKDIGRAFVGIVFYAEFVQVKKDGKAVKIWSEKPHVMLAKCAEAQALRKAFPDELGGLYIAEEMDREDSVPSSTLRGTVLPAGKPETPYQQAERLINTCETALSAKVLTDVMEEAITMPAGEDRKRVSAAYCVALDRVKAGKQQPVEQPQSSGERRPGEEG